MKYYNTDIDGLIGWLDTEGVVHPGLLETLPQRRAALRALESLDEFFEANPEVEMVGLYRGGRNSHGLEELTGHYCLGDGEWIKPQKNANDREFLDLIDEIERCVMDRPATEVEFCLEKIFVGDPGGEFDLLISRQGMPEAVARCVSLNTRTATEENEGPSTHTPRKPGV